MSSKFCAVGQQNEKSLQTAKSPLGSGLMLEFLGSPTWARTRDLRINSPALYQLSYRGTEERIIGIEPSCVKLFVVF